ncbi:hypothetical protein [Methylocystis sp. H62]|uniref:hypothetical protein n=1 Tax=Methylocystis sp. H62 TaxID=2785789 RepID=UPI001FEE5EC6|nr:hypothetical protein [Methylocystis sp. H62]
MLQFLEEAFLRSVGEFEPLNEARHPGNKHNEKTANQKKSNERDDRIRVLYLKAICREVKQVPSRRC